MRVTRLRPYDHKLNKTIAQHYADVVIYHGVAHQWALQLAVEVGIDMSARFVRGYARDPGIGISIDVAPNESISDVHAMVKVFKPFTLAGRPGFFYPRAYFDWRAVLLGDVL